MSRIQVLPDHVANQIAAGEVVERPVAVVKELVENSLDAEAKRIRVEIGRGGKSYIRVTDDGHGMTAEEAGLCLLPHATSKIRAADDLLRINSFGFRGEALPSIASVSDFTLRSRARGQATGVMIHVDNGEKADSREEAIPEGTSIEVARLFNTVPARRKFLKTDQTETAHIIQMVRVFALAHPSVGFELKVDGKVNLSSPPCGGLPERISEIWGRRILKDTLSFERRSGPIFLYGRLGKPPLSRSTRQDLVCVVNGRPVDSRTLQYGIMEACTGSLPKGRYPVAFLFLELPSESIDVNVHPTKREIRFREEPMIRRIVVETILDLLLGHEEEMPQPTTLPPNFEPVQPAPDRPTTTPSSRPTEPPPAPSPFPVSAKTPPVPSSTQPENRTRLPWRYIGPFGNSAILFRSERGLIVFHPRAASERILYEQFLDEFSEEGIQTQGLLIPQTFEWDPLPAQCLEENKDVFHAHGFEVESFGKNFFRVSSVPSWFEPGQTEKFLRDAVGLIREGVIRPEKAGPFRERLATLAAKNAHRRDRTLGEEEATRLARRLLRTHTPHTCPGGKPTFIEFESGDLEKRFGRPL